ncbi:MAG: glycosyltransferase [Gammaproteobacteria bacterium]|nr:glycosyltransferase [Gammaproteobacteria bacterium]
MSRAIDDEPDGSAGALTLPARREAGRLRVAIFSDALPERNGAGAYYEDLAVQLGPRLAALRLFRPAVKRRLLGLALPLPGDSTQKLITPNVMRIGRELKGLRPHLIVAVTPGPFGLLGLYHARRRGCGFLTAFHTHFEGLAELYGGTVAVRLAQGYLERVNHLLCRNSDAVLVNNDALRATVERLGARRVDVMGTPLARAFLDTPPLPPPPRLRQVLFAGRLAPEKNLSEILEASRALPGLRFVMSGDGPLRRELEKAAAQLPNLRLTGWLSRDALRAEMDASSLLLLPSHMETFGTVALESMARGRPALVAESAGIHHWPILGEALFPLAAGDTVTAALVELAALPAEVWTTKAAAARKAAEALNQHTLMQWLDFVERYGRGPRD